MNWKTLESSSDLAYLLENSFKTPQVIFKHSSRCGTSSVVKNRLQNSEGTDYYFLDIIANRALSNKVAEDLKVWHESPQILLVHNGECTYDESHLSIRPREIQELYDELIKTQKA